MTEFKVERLAVLSNREVRDLAVALYEALKEADPEAFLTLMENGVEKIVIDGEFDLAEVAIKFLGKIR